MIQIWGDEMKISRVVFVVLLSISIFLSVYIANLTYMDIIEKEINIIDTYATRIDSALKSQMQVSEIFGEILLIHGGQLTDEHFDRMAAALYNSSIQPSIAYLPDGIFAQVYPYERSSFMLGYNVFDDENARDDALLAKDTGETVVSGPYVLAGGRIGIVIRKPLYIDNEFIGFAVVAVHADKLLDSIGATNLPALGYELRVVSSYKNFEIELFNSEDFQAFYTSSESFKVGDANWHLDLYMKDKNRVVITTFIAWFFILLVGNLFICKNMRNAHRLRENLTKKLETDPLTGACNRTRIEKYVENIGNQKFVIFYLDLNKFKPVNDTYGHEVGDKVLIAFVQRLKTVLESDSIIARIGGDEFVVISSNITTEQEAEAICKQIKDTSEQVFTFEDIHINISSSIGYVFSGEAENLSDLLAIADKKMYTEKFKNNTR